MIVQYLPGEAGYYLRRRYWSKRMKHVGKGVRIGQGVSIDGAPYISLGDHCMISANSVLAAGLGAPDREFIRRENQHYNGEPGEIIIGKNVFLGIGCWLCGVEAGIEIGDDCCVTSYSQLIAHSHHYRSKKDPSNRDICFGGMVPNERHVIIAGPITLGRNTGLAMNCVVLPGVAIAEDCFARIGSVISTPEIPSNSLVAGAPAKIISSRFEAP